MFTVSVYAETTANSGRKIRIERNFKVCDGLLDRRTPACFVAKALNSRKDKGYPFSGETVKVFYQGVIYTFIINSDVDRPRFELVDIAIPALEY